MWLGNERKRDRLTTLLRAPLEINGSPEDDVVVEGPVIICDPGNCHGSEIVMGQS